MINVRRMDFECERKSKLRCERFRTQNIIIDEKHNEYHAIAYGYLIFHCSLPIVYATEKALTNLHEDNAVRP